ncbi:MAG: hypothetical protein U1F43_01300 [Myxococcota bacterium]
MRTLIARLVSTSTPVILSALALGACDMDASAPSDDPAPLVQIAALESGTTVGWTFDVTVEKVQSQYPEFLDVSIPLDFEAQLPTRAPRAAASSRSNGIEPVRAVVADHQGEVRLVDVESHEILFAAPIHDGALQARTSRIDSAWVDARIASHCHGRDLCQRSFRLEVDWQGPGPVTASADLTDAVDGARGHLAIRAQ